MRLRSGRLLLTALAVTATLALGAVPPALASSGERVFRFADPAVVEASALVVQDDLFLTTNDSGDTGRVFAVDASGATVGVTHWSEHPRDTEALAPGGPGFVWVGDIGDNERSRASVEIARVPVGRGDRTVRPTIYRLTYPDGAADAETLLRDPASGRLYLATKSLFGGGVLYAVPTSLHAHGSNRLVPVGRVLPVATDGAFFPDGKHLVVRSYATAVVYSCPRCSRPDPSPCPRSPRARGSRSTPRAGSTSPPRASGQPCCASSCPHGSRLRSRASRRAARRRRVRRPHRPARPPERRRRRQGPATPGRGLRADSSASSPSSYCSAPCARPSDSAHRIAAHRGVSGCRLIRTIGRSRHEGRSGGLRGRHGAVAAELTG